MKGLRIGNLKLKGRLLVAPMVDVSDLPFRMLCKNAGAALTYTEMTHVESILHENKKTKDKLFTIASEKPVGIQITSKTLKGIRDILPFLEANRKNYDLVDLNCGCPSHLTIDHGSGAYLLNDAEKIGKMISILKDNNFVTTVKIRLGFKKNDVMKISKVIEKAGADALTIHGRLANEGRGVPSRLKEIIKVKGKIGIPIIGNGDANDEESVSAMLEVLDGAMIARAAIGDPLIFERINYYMKTGKKKQFDFKKNMKLFLEYLEMAKKHNIVNLQRIKYVGGNFIQRTKGAAQIRNEFVHLKSFDSVKGFVEKLI